MYPWTCIETSCIIPATCYILVICRAFWFLVDGTCEKNNPFALTFVYLGCSTRLLWTRMSFEECLYTVVTNMLFVVHNVSYGRSVLKVGETCFVIDGISAIVLYLCLNWKWVDPKRKIKFSLSHIWKSLFVCRPVCKWSQRWIGNCSQFTHSILHFKYICCF